MAEDPKLAEFRDRNISLMKEIEDLKAKYEGIDPAAVATDRAQLAELKKAPKSSERITELETQLAAEKTARTEAQKKADRALLRDTIGTKALAAGALPSALDILLDKSEKVFGVEGDVIKATSAFSKEKPGEPLSVDEWILGATREFPFLWKASSGGGANPSKGNLFGGHSNQKVLRDPTAQQLGEAANDIRAGKVKVEYS